ncbi:MAG: winged helix-turn-helix domain-containing protein [Candidatus Aenigmarchaeota archaeon]|nr:winged helix-turn-helix domain-containing protein [Candidatus Aenigmarchaeota archaeon]
MGLFDSIKVSEEKKKNLFELKEIAKDERDKIHAHKIKEIVLEELKNTNIDGRIDEICGKLENMEKMLSDMRKSFAPFSRIREDGVRKIKIKRMIAELLKKHRRLTANDVAVMLNLSRTRCSEYLSEMEKHNITKGSVLKRQKFYELDEKYKS